VYGLIDPFYEQTDAAKEAGHIWCDEPIYLPPRHGLKIGRVDPQDDSTLDLTICGRTADIFEHPPINSLKLGASEAAVVARAKRDRPVIVLGGGATEIKPGSTQHAGTLMVVPVYGADQYDERTRRRLMYYEFTNGFYLPAFAKPPFDEGFARLDHVQPVFSDRLVKHRGLKLVPEALDALVEWLIYSTTNRLPEDSVILAYRHEMLTGGV
jgi:hypothetical protein